MNHGKDLRSKSIKGLQEIPQKQPASSGQPADLDMASWGPFPVVFTGRIRSEVLSNIGQGHELSAGCIVGGRSLEEARRFFFAVGSRRFLARSGDFLATAWFASKGLGERSLNREGEAAQVFLHRLRLDRWGELKNCRISGAEGRV